MADFKVIADIGIFLIEKLRQNMVPEPIREPGSIGLYAGEGIENFILSLTLYDIQILNRSFAQDYTSSWPLSLKYIMSVNSKASTDMKAVMDYQILGKAIGVLNEKPIIKKENNFLGPRDLSIDIILENVGLDERVKVCEHVNGVFRTSVFYSVSPVFIDSQIGREAAKVLNG